MNNGNFIERIYTRYCKFDSLLMVKLKDARDEYGFNKVWASDGRIMVMEEGSTKLEVIYGKLLNQ